MSASQLPADIPDYPQPEHVIRNRRSRFAETTGHGLPKWAVTMDRNTQVLQQAAALLSTARSNSSQGLASYSDERYKGAVGRS